MPVTKSAKKKLRKDTKREKQNLKLRDSLKKVLKTTKKSVSAKNVQDAMKVVDKAAKNNIIHKNKANRIKSKLSKLVGVKSQKSIPSKKAKQATKK